MQLGITLMATNVFCNLRTIEKRTYFKYDCSSCFCSFETRG